MTLRPAVVAAVALLTLGGCGAPTLPGDPAALTAPTATRAATPAPHPVGDPTEVTIPAIGVTAHTVPVGLQHDGQLEIPPVTQVGWYRAGVDPGATGPALLAGHVDYDGVNGPFHRLADLNPGDQITVTGPNGTDTFVVTGVATAPKTGIDWRRVLGDTPDPELVLVTCGGPLDSTGHNYEDNVILRARLT